MTDSIKVSDLFTDIPPLLSKLFSSVIYPWEVIPKIRNIIENLINEPPSGFTEYSKGVIIGDRVKIREGVTIMPGTVISSDAEIRQGAYIRGGVFIGEGAVVGHCCELKNSILMSQAVAAHFNYVGDSILGCGAHLGAGVILSNLKADKTEITVHGESHFPTGLRKLGAIIGDGAEIGCNGVLNPGSVIGKNSVVYPLTFWRGVLPAGHIAKRDNITVKNKQADSPERKTELF